MGQSAVRAGTGVHPQLLRMILSAFLFLLGYASSQADDHIDSLECCKYKRVPGLTPKSGDYFLVEHRDDLPDFCKDGCVYVKKSSGDGDNIQYVQYGDGDEEFCFKPSSTYTAQCQEEEEQTQVVPQVNCDFTDICRVDPNNQSYTIAEIQTHQSGILKFEFDNDVSGSWLRILNLPSNSSAFTCLNKICASRDQNPVDAGTWTVLVTSGDTLWNSIPLITTYYVNDINYCEGEEGHGSTNYMTDHGSTEDDMQDHSDMESPGTTTTKTTTMDHQDNMSNHGDMTNHGDMSDHGSMMSDHGTMMDHSK